MVADYIDLYILKMIHKIYKIKLIDFFVIVYGSPTGAFCIPLSHKTFRYNNKPNGLLIENSVQ